MRRVIPGDLCLLSAKQAGAGIESEPTGLPLPDLSRVESLRLSLRAPQVSAQAPLEVAVQLGGPRPEATLQRRFRVPQSGWLVADVPLRWMSLGGRAYPSWSELRWLRISLLQPGVLELADLRFLPGSPAPRMGEVLSLAFSRQERVFRNRGAGVTVYGDRDPRDPALVPALERCRARLARYGLPLDQRPLELLLFHDPAAFQSFWDGYARKQGIPLPPPLQGAAALTQSKISALVYRARPETVPLAVHQLTQQALVRALRLKAGACWVFVGISGLEQLHCAQRDLVAWLERQPQRRFSLAQVTNGGNVPEGGSWIALALVEWLATLHPEQLRGLLARFARAGSTKLEPHLTELGASMERFEEAWRAWVARRFPNLRLY